MSTAQTAVALPPYQTVALVLQGGGALGSYQAGVFEGLAAAGIAPDWLAGISIGALNVAVIAGNPPGTRVERLRQFWDTLCAPAFFPPLPAPLEAALFDGSGELRTWLGRWQAGRALLEGQRGFFVPRVPPPVDSLKAHGPGVASYYDTGPLKSTLERFVDFDRINAQELRVAVGAVNVRTGNFAYFDNTHQRLRPEHFMASGALPPGFPAVEIDGEFYWDGGLVSNTPLAQVLETYPRRDTLVFQVDLWSAEGALPQTVEAALTRQKDIQYSSRTRMVTDTLQRSQRYRRLLRELLEEMPPELRERSHWCELAEKFACSRRYNVIHLIYQAQAFDAQYKDYQFGPTAMRAHWASGLADICATLAHPEWLAMPDEDAEFVTHDIHRRER